MVHGIIWEQMEQCRLTGNMLEELGTIWNKTGIADIGQVKINNVWYYLNGSVKMVTKERIGLMEA